MCYVDEGFSKWCPEVVGINQKNRILRNTHMALSFSEHFPQKRVGGHNFPPKWSPPKGPQSKITAMGRRRLDLFFPRRLRCALSHTSLEGPSAQASLRWGSSGGLHFHFLRGSWHVFFFRCFPFCVCFVLWFCSFFLGVWKKHKVFRYHTKSRDDLLKILFDFPLV